LVKAQGKLGVALHEGVEVFLGDARALDALHAGRDHAPRGVRVGAFGWLTVAAGEEREGESEGEKGGEMIFHGGAPSMPCARTRQAKRPAQEHGAPPWQPGVRTAP